MANRPSYWRKRPEGRKYDLVRFRNGYAAKAPEILAEFLDFRKYGNGRSGHYAIRPGRILKINRFEAA